MKRGQEPLCAFSLASTALTIIVSCSGWMELKRPELKQQLRIEGKWQKENPEDWFAHRKREKRNTETPSRAWSFRPNQLIP